MPAIRDTADQYRRQLETIADNATVALFIMDERQQCTFMNPAAEQLTGYSLHEVQGRPLHEVIHHTRPDGTPYPLEECPIDRAFPQQAREQGEEIFVHRDGTFYPVAFTASPIREGARTIGTIIEVRDLRSELEHRRLRHDEMQLVLTLQRVGNALASTLDLPAIVQAVTDEATALTGAQFGAFFYNLADERGERYTLYSISGVPREAFAKFPMPRNTAIFEPTFRGAGIVRSDDITKDPRYGRNPPYQGMPPGHLPVRSHLAVPVISRTGEVLGGLFFGHAEPARFTERHERLAVGISGWAAVAIDNARLFAAEQQARRTAEEATARLAQMQGVAAALAAARTVRDVASVLASQGSAALGAQGGVVALVEAGGATLEYVGWAGYPEAVRGEWQHLPLSYRSPLTDAVREADSIWVPSPEALAERWPEFALVAPVIPTGAWAAVPLVLNDESGERRVLGALGLSFAMPRHFTAEERELATTLAQQSAQALERARLYVQAEAARAEAVAANRAKSEFLAMMSHELRTPLNAIAGYADLLALEVHGPVTEAQQSDLRRIKHNQGVLLGLINDVLNFAKLEAGRLEVDAVPVAIAEVVTDLQLLIEPYVAARGLRYEVPPVDRDLVAIADAERVQQVLLNLLTNAVKFTEPGGLIEVTAHRHDGQVHVRVRDTGRGIATDRLEAIFDPFVQLERKRGLLQGSQQGVGLGLAISRELARAMGGDLRVESVLGAGSMFTLTLPHAPGAPDGAEAQSLPGA